jgi:hypothetical protein
VLADAEVVDADLVGEDALLHHVPDGLGVGERAAVGVVVRSPNVSRPNSRGNACRHVA